VWKQATPPAILDLGFDFVVEWALLPAAFDLDSALILFFLWPPLLQMIVRK
jgi:hypothetical protein